MSLGNLWSPTGGQQQQQFILKARFVSVVLREPKTSRLYKSMQTFGSLKSSNLASILRKTFKNNSM